ncbi:MAG: signal recognition particle-docking protein FtsY [Alphaproteobacteria bacterium]|nr:signal recognition particle-docking protein FtsY [Alphaproteobacteria bacterium]
MAGLFARIKQGLSRTAAPLVSGIESLLTKRKLDKDTLTDLEDLLIMADVGAKTAAVLTAELAKEKFDKEVSAEEVRTFFADKIAAKLEPFAQELKIDPTKKPFVILMAGVNGAGKTTTIGKMAQQLKDKGLKVTFAAADTFRAAAVEQLKVWGERTGCPVVSKPTGADAAGLVFDAITQARQNGDDVLFIDTAGRLQNRSELMDELQKIIRIIKKQIPDAPHACLQVLDATVGQNAHSQVKIFSETVPVTGLILTKLDGTAKGGVIVALAEEFKLPVHLIGVGEQIDDLRPFKAQEYARSLMGLAVKEAL